MPGEVAGLGEALCAARVPATNPPLEGLHFASAQSRPYAHKEVGCVAGATDLANYPGSPSDRRSNAGAVEQKLRPCGLWR